MVSFVIPAYNAELFIRKCIESIQKIDRIPIEILIVNDGSADDTKTICESIVDPRIKVINQENQGVSIARNNGIKNARGKYICFVDADDEICSQKFEELADYLNEENEIIMFNYASDFAGRLIEQTMIVKEGIYQDDMCKHIIDKMLDIHIYKRDGKNALGAKVWQYLYSREFLNSNQLMFDRKLPYAEDLCFCVEALSKCKKLRVVDLRIYIQNIIDGTASRRYRENFWIELQNVYERLTEILGRERMWLYHGYGKAAINHYTSNLSAKKALEKCMPIVREDKFINAIQKETIINKTIGEQIEDYCYSKNKVQGILYYKVFKTDVKKIVKKVLSR